MGHFTYKKDWSLNTLVCLKYILKQLRTPPLDRVKRVGEWVQALHGKFIAKLSFNFNFDVKV